MKILFLTHCLPNLNSHGGAEHSYGLINELKRQHHKISLCGICEEREFKNFKDDEKLNKIKSLVQSSKVFKIPRRKNIISELIRNPFSLFNPADELILPSILLKKKVELYVKKINPDVILIFNFSEAITVMNLNYPKLIFAGDMLHIPHITRVKFAKQINPKSKINFRNCIRTVGILWMSIFQKKLMLKILNNANQSGSWCYQYSLWFKKRVLTNKHKFYRVTLVDPKKKMIRKKRKKIKILTKLSSFEGTSTLISLNYLFKEVFPILEKKLHNTNYEIHVIGKGGLPQNLKYLEKHNKIIVRGFVKNLNNEINSSDIVLFPNPAEIGLRCRILNAFANYGCCIIHKSDTVGIPEIKNYKNCLVGSNADEISDLVLYAINNKKKKFEIKNNARKTFANYSSKNSIIPIIEDINKLYKPS